MTTRRIPTEAELAAIDAIFSAYMTLARLPDSHPLSWEVSVGNTYGGTPTPLGHLAHAGREAWGVALGHDEVYIPGAGDPWETMIDSGEGAAYVLGLIRQVWAGEDGAAPWAICEADDDCVVDRYADVTEAAQALATYGQRYYLRNIDEPS